MSNIKKIPIGIADFETLRQGNYVYADKTELLYRLVGDMTPYFLSRPRRFGKSSLVSALEAILTGRRELFEGLWIHDRPDYDWTPNPVIYLSLNSVATDSVATVQSSLLTKLKDIAKDENLEPNGETPADFFESLFRNLNKKYNRKIAVLIDEYDAPILSKLTETDLANKIRETLGTFYSILKSAEKYRGFTLEEFNSLFADRMSLTLARTKSMGIMDKEAAAEDLKNKILDWYDGYTWDGQTRVLNPWSVLNFFDNSFFSEYWYASGGTSFLANLIKERQIDLASFSSRDFLTDGMNTIDIGTEYSSTALLFQAGYLTVDRVLITEGGKEFYLRFPNLEIKAAMARLWLFLKKPLKNVLLMKMQAQAMLEALIQRQADEFQMTFKSFLSHIPWEDQLRYEAYCETVFLMAMVMAGQECDCQQSVGSGKLDVHLRARDGNDYVIELKFVQVKVKDKEGKDKALTNEQIQKNMEKAVLEAMDQIEGNKYALKFQGQGNKIYKAALVVSGHADVRVAFEEAASWTLMKDPGQPYYSVKKV
ncbi:MAG: ATP-binding protein [Deltaproteobacteria bacterium]|nr:ATP-binding protein [Deltaproteobacteria bacterium]